MLRKDKEDFLAFVSGDLALTQKAIDSLNSRMRGHFEDNPMSSKLVKQYMNELIDVWSNTAIVGARQWVVQFVADAGAANEKIKPLIYAALSDSSCTFLPAVIYLMTTAPWLFGDSGGYLLPLASHRDRGVRWRIAYFLSIVKGQDEDIKKCIELLSQDKDETTQLYANEWRRLTFH